MGPKAIINRPRGADGAAGERRLGGRQESQRRTCGGAAGANDAAAAQPVAVGAAAAQPMVVAAAAAAAVPPPVAAVTARGAVMQAPAPPPPFCAFLDDQSLRLSPGFGESHVAAIRLVAQRLAEGGLRVNPTKSLAIARRGHIFSAADRERLGRLRMPFVDATTPAEDRGFVTVGVPVGTAAFVAQQLRAHLCAAHMWRMAWQLTGMAGRHFQAAFRIFRWSLCKRMGYLARNVDPLVGVAYFGAFDGFCLWVLERLLHLHGAAGAADMRAHLLECSSRGDAVAASFGGPLTLPRYSSAAVWAPDAPAALPQLLAAVAAARPALALRVAQLPARAGGLGLPHLRTTCVCAFVGQLSTTLHKRALRVMADLPPPVVPVQERLMDGAAPWPAAGSLPPFFVSLRASARLLWSAFSVQAQPDGDLVVAPAALQPLTPESVPPAPLQRVLSAPMLAWIAGSSVSPTAALVAAAAADAPLPANPENGEGEPQLLPPPLPPLAPAPGQPAHDDDDDDLLGDELARHPQRLLSAYLARLTWRLLVRDLQQLGAAGVPLLAQLRSQSGPGALSWLDVPPSAGVAMTPVAAITMTLVAIFVEPWRIDGDDCPYRCSRSARPTCVHVLSCQLQRPRGQVATHEAHKSCLQQLLRTCGAPYFLSEDITSSDYDGDRADTVVLPGVLHMCGDAAMERRGVVLDNRICAPTAATFCPRAAAVNGFAARSAEAEKRARYDGQYDARRWVFVPFIQESFGRLGGAARAFIARLAVHAAARAGGSERVVRKRRSMVRRRIVVTLSATLARELAERILAYVRCAQLGGRAVRPVSSLLATAR